MSSGGIGDTGITVAKVAAGFGAFKAAFTEKDNIKASDALNHLKCHLVFLPTFLDPSVRTATFLQEWMLARETLEHACLLSVRRKDMAELELYFQQLRVYYVDMVDPAFTPSTLQYMILGLNLLRLLVQSRTAEFHTELQRIPHQEHGNMYIRFAIMLERYLMEGSYNRLLHVRSQAPSNEYLHIVELLESTVRSEAAACIPTSYPSLSTGDAQKMLMLASPAEALAFGRKCGWQLNADGTQFVFARSMEEQVVAASAGSAKSELPMMEMLKNHIQFADQLQRVV
jgi:26S proteasome regulatory subunit N12